MDHLAGLHHYFEHHVANAAASPVGTVLPVEPDTQQSVDHSHRVSERFDDIPAQPVHEEDHIAEADDVRRCDQNGQPLVVPVLHLRLSINGLNLLLGFVDLAHDDVALVLQLADGGRGMVFILFAYEVQNADFGLLVDCAVWG